MGLRLYLALLTARLRCCLQTLTKRNGEETKKRPITIRDSSNRSIELTLWGDTVYKPGGKSIQQVYAATQDVKQLLPEVGHEFRVSVRNDC